MTVHPLGIRGQWYLGRDRVMTGGQTRLGQSDRKYEYGGFWTGDRWAKGRRHAAVFATEEEAAAYMDSNYGKMDV